MPTYTPQTKSSAPTYTPQERSTTMGLISSNWADATAKWADSVYSWSSPIVVASGPTAQSKSSAPTYTAQTKS